MTSKDTTNDTPPLPVREPGATLRDNPVPPPRVTLDHHADKAFGGGTPRRDTTTGPHANRAF